MGPRTSRMKDYTDKAWIVIVILCIIFWIVGCAITDNYDEEVKTYPLPEEDPILEKLIELGEVETL
jgi:hypothetical protein